MCRRLLIKILFISILLLLTFCCRSAHAEQSTCMIQNGYELIMKKSYFRAIGIFKAVLQSNPDDVQARRYLAFALHQIGMSTKAAEQMELVIKRDPYNIDDRARVASMYMFSGDNRHAIGAFRICLVINPEYDQALWGLAIAYVKAGDEFNAHQTCLRALKTCRQQNTRKRCVEILRRMKTADRVEDARG